MPNQSQSARNKAPLCPKYLMVMHDLESKYRVILITREGGYRFTKSVTPTRLVNLKPGQAHLAFDIPLKQHPQLIQLTGYIVIVDQTAPRRTLLQGALALICTYGDKRLLCPPNKPRYDRDLNGARIKYAKKWRNVRIKGINTGLTVGNLPNNSEY